MAARAPSRTLVLFNHNLTMLAREPGPLASRLVMPLVAIAVFEPLDRAAIGSRGGAVQAVTGMLVLFSMLSLALVGGSVLAERLWRTWDRLRMTPVRPLELLVGKSVPTGIVLAVQQAAVLGFGIVAEGLHARSLALLTMVVLVWSATLVAIGSALSLIARSQAELAAIQDIGSFIVTSLGGALVPLAEMPSWARQIAPASPAYWAMSSFRAAVDGNVGAAIHSGSVLLGIAAIATGLAVWRLKRSSTRSARL